MQVLQPKHYGHHLSNNNFKQSKSPYAVNGHAGRKIYLTYNWPHRHHKQRINVS